eukprot:2620990-Rhodomonas_salina.1
MLFFIIQGGGGVGARFEAEISTTVSGVRGATARHDGNADSHTLIVFTIEELSLCFTCYRAEEAGSGSTAFLG